jgi:glycolate oxidase FAD binding subunit
VAVAIDLVGLAAGLETAGVPWDALADAERVDHVVDGVSPVAICWPESYEQAAHSLAVADRLGLAVCPRGRGSKRGLGAPPLRCDLIVSTERLDQVVEYAPSNLTVIAQAGLSLATLQRTLGPAHQYLPLDPPFASTATLGGIVATNASGPRRLGFGTARDLVIGTRVATIGGLLTRSGGRVVKNVAGYDLNKLYIGSLGTLALILEVGFKIAPRPIVQTTVVGCFDHVDQVGQVSRALLRSPFMPVAFDLFNQSAAEELELLGLPNVGDGYLLAVLGAAPGDAVGRQAAEFARLFQEGGATQIADIVSDECDEFWAKAAERGYAGDSSSRIRLKLAVPPGRIAEGLHAVSRRRDDFCGKPSVGGRAGSGTILVNFDVPNEKADARISESIRTLRDDCQQLAGSLVVEECPVQLKTRVDVWGEVGPSVSIMRKLKDALDPSGTLNPGRFVGGI